MVRSSAENRVVHEYLAYTSSKTKSFVSPYLSVLSVDTRNRSLTEAILQR